MGKRPDGYHNLETLFVPVLDLCDTLTIESTSSPTTSMQQDGIVLDNAPDDNLCMKAYRILQHDFNLPPVHIQLTNLRLAHGLVRWRWRQNAGIFGSWPQRGKRDVINRLRRIRSCKGAQNQIGPRAAQAQRTRLRPRGLKRQIVAGTRHPQAHIQLSPGENSGEGTRAGVISPGQMALFTASNCAFHGVDLRFPAMAILVISLVFLGDFWYNTDKMRKGQ